MSTIVCGIDDSPAARPVGETAAWLAGALGAQLMAVHVEDGRTLAADAVLAAFSPPPFRIEPELRFAGGPPAQALMQVAAESEAGFLSSAAAAGDGWRQACWAACRGRSRARLPVQS